MPDRIEIADQLLRVGAVEADADVVREALLRMRRSGAIPAIVVRMPSRSRSARARVRSLSALNAGLRDAQRLRGADDAGHVLRTGASLPLLAAAVLLCEKRHAAAKVEDAHALRTAELVRRQA